MLVLPWPPKILSPNARPHWAVKARAVKAYRAGCYLLAKGFPVTFGAGDIPLTVTFCPPDARRRDRDNLIASMKAGMDGIAQAWGVDDSRFVPTYRMGKPVEHGEVVIEVGK